MPFRPRSGGASGPAISPAPYLKYKLPEASEEIVDPHNLFLEVWATGGFWAVVCLLAALAWGFWNLLGPPSRDRQSQPMPIIRGAVAIVAETGHSIMSAPSRSLWTNKTTSRQPGLAG